MTFLRKLHSRFLVAASFKLDAEKILTSQRSVDGAYRNYQRGRSSKTKGPLEVWHLEDGRYLLVDGQHRFVEGLVDGKKTFEVVEVGEGYTDYWATPPKGQEFDVEKFRRDHDVETEINAKNTSSLDGLLKRTATESWREEFIEEQPEAINPSRKMLDEKLDEKLDELFELVKAKAKYKGGRLVVYRCLSATVEEFMNSKRVGNHWTFADDNIHCWEQGRKDKDKWIVLEGTIALKDIHLEETLGTNLSFDFETEATLKEGAPASIERIFPYSDRKKTLKKFSPALVKKN